MGSGKSSVLAEASDILAQRHIVHAAIDLDALALAHLPCGAHSDLVMYDNLRSICRNYAALQIERFLVARALEDAAELRLCREIISTENTMICRLTASLETMQRRVQMRESGIAQRDYVARVAELNAILDRVRLEAFTITTENRPVNDVALEMLAKAGWISN
jgi:hypothetical protein